MKADEFDAVARQALFGSYRRGPRTAADTRHRPHAAGCARRRCSALPSSRRVRRCAQRPAAASAPRAPHPRGRAPDSDGVPEVALPEPQGVVTACPSGRAWRLINFWATWCEPCRRVDSASFKCAMSALRAALRWSASRSTYPAASAIKYAAAAGDRLSCAGRRAGGTTPTVSAFGMDNTCFPSASSPTLAGGCSPSRWANCTATRPSSSSTASIDVEPAVRLALERCTRG